MQHQSPEYDSVPAESTQLVSRFKWRLMRLALVLTIVIGIVFVFASAIGLFDPPHAYYFLSSLPSGDFGVHFHDDLWQLSRFPQLSGTPPFPPFTIIAVATNTGNEDSGWGLWANDWRFVVNNQGYISCADTYEPNWAEFIHVQNFIPNTLYLHIEADGYVTFRINGEIACQHSLPAEIQGWGTLHYKQPKLQWYRVTSYAGKPPI